MLKVQRKSCSTCIFRKKSPLDLASLLRQVADPRMAGHFKGARLCHHAANKDKVVCAGFWARYKDNFDMGQLAQRLNMVEKVDVDVRGKK